MYLLRNDSVLSRPMLGLLLALTVLAQPLSLPGQQPSSAVTARTNVAADGSRRILSKPIMAPTADGAYSGTNYPGWDTYSDTWVATDALGRSLPSCSEAGLPRQHRTVGAFYFLWLYPHGGLGPFDITQILTKDPQASTNAASPLWGPMHEYHHWGEPIFGYYLSDDEAVLRKHAQMLADAGVDVIIFDVTNQQTYPRSWKALCRVFDQIRREGGQTPQIAFLCPFWDAKKVARELWEQLYSPGLYPDLWFRWEGKPLILADPAQTDLGPEVRSRFTFRKPQPDYFIGPTGPDQWGWLEVHPQHVFTNAAGAPEQMAVGVAQNAADGKLSVLSNPRSLGRSFHDGREPAPADCDYSGRNFAEQWRRAFQVDPEFIFLTGWNEWIAMRFDHRTSFHATGPVTFVDEFNGEFSRDIEPVKGGHGDDYYYQMIANIRRYKGVRPLLPVKSQPIAIDGRFGDWATVEPEFRDTIGDPVKRDHAGWAQGQRYVNRTGRNDIVAAKVSLDANNVYFYVRTRTALTPASDPNWMLLFIDADCDARTGWLGYDFIVNRVNVRAQTTTLERNAGGYRWGSPVDVACRVAGNELELAVPRSALGLTKLPATLDFKWADNIQQTGEAADFTLNGDAAPNDRFNYRASFP
jgi:hypothetical protein